MALRPPAAAIRLLSFFRFFSFGNMFLQKYKKSIVHFLNFKIMVQFIGNVVRDAVMKEVNGMQVANFTIALNHEYTKSSGEIVKLTTYIDCQYWRKSNMHKDITKGREVVVLGRVFPDAYSNKNGEIKGIIRFKVDKLFAGEESNSQAGNDTTTNEDEGGPVGKAEPSDDLPF